MRDYKNSKVIEPMSAAELMSGLCFGAVFYGVIFLLMVI